MPREFIVMNQDVRPFHFLGRGETCTRWVIEYPDARKFHGIREARAARKKSGTLNAKIIEHYSYENEMVIE